MGLSCSMKYLLISDIHGSYKYLDLVLNKCNDIDKIIILGDILYHGPRNDLPNEYNPKLVINKLNSIKDKIICVRGNCDAKVDLEMLEFAIKDHIKLNVNGCKCFLTHGDIYNKNNLPRLSNCNLLYGHYHINEVIESKKKVIINLGSLSIPKDKHHSYAVIEDNVYTAYDLMSDKVILKVNLK